MRKTLAIGSVVLALAGCKKDEKQKDEPAAKPTAKTAGEPKAPDAPPPRYKGVPPLAMPAAVTLTPEETAQVTDLAGKAMASVTQYGVQRGGFEDDLDKLLVANPKLLMALMQSASREVQIAAGQEYFDLQSYGEPVLVPTPEAEAIVMALMTSKDDAVAASVTQSAHGGERGENADKEIQQLLQRQCLDDTRVAVRAAACSGVVDHLNAHFGNVPDAQEVVAKALVDESDYVVWRTLDVLASMSWDAKYLDVVLPLLAHEEPAIRGKAAMIVDRTLSHDDQTVPEAATRGHDALVPLLKDAEPYVRCGALIGLSSWSFVSRWDSAAPMIALMDDKAVPETKLAYQSLPLDGPKDDSWSTSISRDSVGECAIAALISKANSVSGDLALGFQDWPNQMTAGREAFTAWWTANQAALLAAKP